MSQQLHLDPLVITHGVDNIFRVVCFSTRKYAFLETGARALIFVSHTIIAAEKLLSKVGLWDNSLCGNVHPSVYELYQLISIDKGPRHVEWVTVVADSKVLAALLSMLWLDFHSLLLNIILFLT